MAPTACNTVLSERGNIKISVNGYLYTLRSKRIQKTTGQKTYYWRCERRGCKGTATTHFEDDCHYLKNDSEHTCGAAEPSRINIVKCHNAVKEKANITSDKPCQIIQDVLSHVNSSVVPYVGSKESLKKVISRVRKEGPREPNDFDDLFIPDEYRKTLSGGTFLVKESSIGNEKVLLFTTHSNVKNSRTRLFG